MRVLFALVVLSACSAPWTEEQTGGRRHLAMTADVPAEGGTFRVDVEDGETAFLISAVPSNGNFAHFQELDVHDGAKPDFDADAADPNHATTNAPFLSSVSVLNWPIVGGDPELSPGKAKFRVAAATAEPAYLDDTVAFDVWFKADPDFTQGALSARVLYADGLEADPVLVAGTEAAVAHWQELYADIGITVNVEYATTSVTGFEPPGFGSPDAWEEASAEGDPLEVKIVVTEEIATFADAYGVAGGIPGPIGPSRSSGVLVSALLAVGPDGNFSTEEQRLYGETLAHETGHYLGLFHPVEITWDDWDGLSDTPECGTESECVDALSKNLMFPTPVCGFRTCTPQNDITGEQTDVVQRNTSVD